MTETRKLAAIMFTDIVGYSAMMSKDEKQALRIYWPNNTQLFQHQSIPAAIGSLN